MLSTVFPTLLLCIGAAATGLLCARVVKTTTAAMIVVSLALAMLYLVHGFLSTNIFERNCLHYIYLFNILSAYGNYLSAMRLYYVRGVKNIYADLFVYDDVINVGTSFIYLFFDSAVMILLAILVDFKLHTRNVPCCDRMLQHDESVPNVTRTYRESWHEKIALTAEPVLSVESV
ncbi:unnamed protein product, partial [Cylicocyclus nassatus]